MRRDFAFANTDAVNNKDKWRDALGVKDIIILPDVQAIDNLSESPTYNRSNQDYDWLANGGKYIYRFKFAWKFDYSKELSAYSLSNYDIGIIDSNKNIYLTNRSGSIINGLSTDIINFEKQPLFDNQFKYTSLYVMLSDWREISINGIVAKLDFNAFKQVRKPLTITILEVVDNSTLRVNVVDALQGIALEGLTVSDFNLIDGTNGILSINSITDEGDGNYTLNGISPNLISGRLNIDTNQFYGYTDYTNLNPVNNLDITYGGMTTLKDGSGNTYYYIYIKCSFEGNIIGGLDRNNFTDTSNSSKSVYYTGNGGVYYIITNSLTGTVNYSDENYIGDLEWDISGLFYECNMEGLYPMLGGENQYYMYSQGGVNTLDVIGTNPNNNQWRAIVNGLYALFYLTYGTIGTDYTMTIDVSTISANGKFEIYDGDTLLQQIAATGQTVINYTSTSKNTIFRFQYYGGSLDIVINSIKIEY